MRHTLEHSVGKGREGGRKRRLAIVRRHLVASFVYTILDIGQDGIGSGRKGNGHQHEICKAQHALERKEKKGSARGNLCRRQIQNTCPARERQRERESERKGGRQLTYVEAINCLFIVCYLFAFLFIASCFVSSPTARAETTQHRVRPVTVTVTTLVTANR